MSPPRLDVLLYAHDGRGLGHVSRTVAIGMALRRLYPDLKVVLVTGCKQTQELIGPAPLDWLKLPAYETEVISGKSRGIDGSSNFSDTELQGIREEQIRQVVKLYQPRLLLTDHSPQGKHKELVKALGSINSGDKMQCVLGMRGVIGSVSQTESPLAIELYARHFSQLLWYGDSTVIGTEHKDMLSERFSTIVHECGYVSRFREVRHLLPLENSVELKYGCTVSIPWVGEHTDDFLEILAQALLQVGSGFGPFRIFIGDSVSGPLRARLESIEFCTVESFGTDYLRALCESRSAIIFGGYNSLVDVLAIEIPALVVLREMNDREQCVHAESLAAILGQALIPVQESSSNVSELHDKLTSLLEHDRQARHAHLVNLDGAEHGAHALVKLL